MTRFGPYATPRQLMLPRRRVLLVLGLLVGLLGMHAMGPMAPQAAERVPTAAMSPASGPEQRVMQPVMTAEAGHDDCGTGAHDCHGGAQHADATCASAAVPGGPLMPALTVAPGFLPPALGVTSITERSAPDDARAPPSLAELQLLRI